MRYRAYLASLPATTHHATVTDAAEQLSSGSHLSLSAGRLSPLRRAHLSDSAGRLPSLDQVFIAQSLRTDQSRALDTTYEWQKQLPWTNTIWEAIESQHILLIEAGPGMGKSVLLRKLARETIRQRARHFVPVVMPARSLLVEYDLPEAICRHVQEDMAPGDRNLIVPDLFRFPPADASDWLILVDDIDELAWDATDSRPELIQRLIFQIERSGAPMRFVLVARRFPDEFHTRARVARATLNPLGGVQASVFAHQWFRNMPGSDPTEVAAAGFLSWLHRHGLIDLIRYTSANPLLLTHAALLFEAHRYNTEALENRAWVYTELASLTLGTQNGYACDRELLSDVWRRLQLDPTAFRWDSLAMGREGLLEAVTHYRDLSRPVAAVAQDVLEREQVLPNDTNDRVMRKVASALAHTTRLLAGATGHEAFVSGEWAAFFSARSMVRMAERRLPPRSHFSLGRLFADRRLALPFPDHLLASVHSQLTPGGYETEVVAHAVALAQYLRLPCDIDRLLRRELGRDLKQSGDMSGGRGRVQLHARGVVLAGHLLAAGVRPHVEVKDIVWEDLLALALHSPAEQLRTEWEVNEARHVLSRFGAGRYLPIRFREILAGGSVDDATSESLISIVMGCGAVKELSLLVLNAIVDRTITVPAAAVNAAVWALVRLGCGQRAAGLLARHPSFSARVLVAHTRQLMLSGRSREATDGLVSTIRWGFAWEPDEETQHEAVEILLDLGEPNNLEEFLAAAAEREIPIDPDQYQRAVELIERARLGQSN